MPKRKAQYMITNARPLKRRGGTSLAVLRAGPAPAKYRGIYRKSGFYGRFGTNARNVGNRPEKKFFDTFLTFSIDTTGEVPATGQLALIPQGDTESTRDGRQCVIKSWHIKADLSLVPAAAANPSGMTQICLVQDTQCNGAAAAFGDIVTAGVSMDQAPINMSNSSRFRILKKWTHSWNPTAGVTTAYCNMTKHIEKFKRCNIPLQYSSTTGAITEIKSNNLFLIAGANTANIDDLVTCNGSFRVRFTG